MPFFRYIASDANGRTLEGTLQATSGQEATQLLARQGLSVTHLSGSGTPVASAVQKPTVRASPWPAPAAASPRSSVETRPAAPPHVNSIQSVAKPTNVVRTKRGSDKHLFFMFSQLAGYFRAGMNPRTAFQDIASKSPPLYQPSLQEIAQRAGEGLQISEVLERYPDLYPPHVVGMVRAGEMAGFLPEAFQEVADWAHPSYRLKRAMSIFNNVAVILVVGFPIGLAVVNGSLNSWDVQEASGGETPVGPLLIRLMSRAALPLILPTALILVAYYLGRYFWKGDANRMNRHRLLLTVPILGRRARAESLRQFAYALGLISQAGVSPHTAFGLSADAMANLDMAERLRATSVKSDTSTKLTTMLGASDVVPREYQNVIDTGEITGDVPGAALHVADATNVEFQAADGSTKYVKSFLGILVFGAGIILFFLLLRFMMSGEITHVLGTD
jgi:general secretion pathway protein F